MGCKTSELVWEAAWICVCPSNPLIATDDLTQTFYVCFGNPKLLHEFRRVWASQPSSEMVNQTSVLEAGSLPGEESLQSKATGELDMGTAPSTGST